MLKILLSLLFFGIMSISFVHAQAPQEIVKQHSVDWMLALERKDTAALEKYLAPEFVLGGVGDGNKVERATWIKNANERNWTNTKYHFIEVHVQGNTAIVNSRFSFKVNPVPFTITSNIIDQWVYRNGRWQVTARFIGGDSITGLIDGSKGVLVGVVLTLLMVWLLRFRKRRRVKQQ